MTMTNDNNRNPDASKQSIPSSVNPDAEPVSSGDVEQNGADSNEETIWIVEIEQEVGVTIIASCTSRGVARLESERIASEIDDPIESWTGDWGEGTSEWGSMESGRRVLITRRRLIDSPRGE